MAIPLATRVMAYLCVALGIDYYYNHKQNRIFESIIKQTNIMAQIKIQICSNHYSGKDYYENSISLELNDELLGDFVSSTEIDWHELNSHIFLDYPDYISIVKAEMRKNMIEIRDPNYWTTEGIVVAINNIMIPEDLDWFEIHDHLRTGDLL